MSRATAPSRSAFEEASLTLNGPPASAALPPPSAAGPAAHMTAPPARGTYDPSAFDEADLSGVDLKSESAHHRAFVHCEWKGTLNDLSDPSNVQLRRIAVGRFPDTWDTTDSNGTPLDLSRAVVLSINAKSVHSTFKFPVALAFTGTGAKSLNQLSTRIGRVAMVVGHKEQSRGSHAIYTPDDSVSSSQFRKYAHHTVDSLRSQIVRFPSFCYVPSSSPIVDIMSKNKDVLCVDLNPDDLRESSYFRVDHQVVDRVLDELDKKVLQRMPFVDMSSLGVEISRTTPHDFNNPVGTHLEGAPSGATTSANNAMNTVTCELEIVYGFPAAR